MIARALAAVVLILAVAAGVAVAVTVDATCADTPAGWTCTP